MSLFSFLFLPALYQRASHGFRLAKCRIAYPTRSDWKGEIPFDFALLDQPFHYWTKGGQSFVFLSKDGRFVLKLFRFDFSRIRWGQKLVRASRKLFGLREKHDLPPLQKVEKTLGSCKLLFDLAKEETALLFIHLNPEKLPLDGVELSDRFGRTIRLDPEKDRFIVQKKGDSLRTVFRESSNPGALVAQYRELLNALSRKGLTHLDPTMGRNFAFLDGRAVAIDLGNFAYDPIRASLDPPHFMARLDHWLAKEGIE